jgi:DNA polymerase-3 subunit delta
MAKLEEKAALEEVKRSGPRPIYYLFGEDAYKIQNFVSQITAGQTPEVYFGDELDPNEFLDSAKTRSLWSPAGKVMIVRNADAITAKKWEVLEDIWRDDAVEGTVVFLAIKADARLKTIQTISKHKRAALVKFETPFEGELLQWANQFAKQQGKKLSNDARHMLLANSSSLFDLLHDIEKAALFSGGSEEISAQHVAQTGVGAKEESVFSVMDAVLAGNEREALSGIAALLAQREEPLGLIALLAKQYNSLLKILALKGEGRSDAEIQSTLGLHPFVAKKLIPIGRRLGPYAVLRALKALAAADIALKTTREPADLVMTRAIAEIMHK